MNRYVSQVCAICMIAMLTITAWAQSDSVHATPATPEAKAKATADTIKAISDQLQNDDPQAVTQAIIQIRELLQSDPLKSVAVFRSNWLKRLMALQRYDDLQNLSLLAILASPSDTNWVELLQKYRVQSLLAEGRTPEALAAAKQLFAVSTMKGTAEAIQIVCQCLNAVYPDDRSVLRRYRKEQIDGARRDASSSAAAPLMLSSVQIDPAPFQAAIRRCTAEDYATLTGEGNLMLLAGDSKGAWDVFERAYTLATDRDLAAASENLARCMKAQDGTIGRANAWVLSIRPKARPESNVAAFAATQASHQE